MLLKPGLPGWASLVIVRTEAKRQNPRYLLQLSSEILEFFTFNEDLFEIKFTGGEVLIRGTKYKMYMKGRTQVMSSGQTTILIVSKAAALSA